MKKCAIFIMEIQSDRDANNYRTRRNNKQGQKQKFKAKQVTDLTLNLLITTIVVFCDQCGPDQTASLLAI